MRFSKAKNVDFTSLHKKKKKKKEKRKPKVDENNKKYLFLRYW